MFWTKNWEVCLYSDLLKYQVMRKNFRTLWCASRFVRKVLCKDGEFYCATIWRKNTSLCYAFYWNGKRIRYKEYSEKSLVFSRRQAGNLEVNKYGNIVIRPLRDERDTARG